VGKTIVLHTETAASAAVPAAWHTHQGFPSKSAFLIFTYQAAIPCDALALLVYMTSQCNRMSG